MAESSSTPCLNYATGQTSSYEPMVYAFENAISKLAELYMAYRPQLDFKQLSSYDPDDDLEDFICSSEYNKKFADNFEYTSDFWNLCQKLSLFWKTANTKTSDAQENVYRDEMRTLLYKLYNVLTATPHSDCEKCELLRSNFIKELFDICTKFEKGVNFYHATLHIKPFVDSNMYLIFEKGCNCMKCVSNFHSVCTQCNRSRVFCKYKAMECPACTIIFNKSVEHAMSKFCIK
jgi:hypothetical protein